MRDLEFFAFVQLPLLVAVFGGLLVGIVWVLFLRPKRTGQSVHDAGRHE